ncbi:MAG: Dyp-type peroxidase [Micrococcus sp.]|nr:Dyp-type peroxidase [Micrococcus sp.]
MLGAGALGGGLLGTSLGYALGAQAGPAAAPPAGGPATEAPAPTGQDTHALGTDGWAEPGGEADRVAVTTPVGTDVVPYYGPRQAGIDTPAQAHAVFLAFDLRASTDRDALRRLMRVLTDASARLTQGRATLADTEPELAAAPARLTVTLGYGPELLRRAAPQAAPSWLAPLPAFAAIDELRAAYSDGDLLLQICGDDPMSVAHARRMLIKSTRSFATLRWSQAGFRAARGSHPDGTTMRNLFGQVDGTANPPAESPASERLVWGVDGDDAGLRPWTPNGTSLVIRRIRMDLDTWDHLGRAAKEDVIGRRLGSGAPLTGNHEHDPVDFEATGASGFPVISDIAHVRRARRDGPEAGMLRRGYNYDEDTESGLIFAAYQCDVDRQFIPVQQRLAESDHLNLWTTPVGSAVFAIPPGCQQGGYIGDSLF